MSSQGDVKVEDGGGGMTEVREQVVTQLVGMIKMVMMFQERIVMVMIGIQMMMVVMMITGG